MPRRRPQPRKTPPFSVLNGEELKKLLRSSEGRVPYFLRKGGRVIEFANLGDTHAKYLKKINKRPRDFDGMGYFRLTRAGGRPVLLHYPFSLCFIEEELEGDRIFASSQRKSHGVRDWTPPLHHKTAGKVEQTLQNLIGEISKGSKIPEIKRVSYSEYKKSSLNLNHSKQSLHDRSHRPVMSPDTPSWKKWEGG